MEFYFSLSVGTLFLKADQSESPLHKAIPINFVIHPFIFQLPFTLTLRVWDIFMLEGEKILTGMSYNIIRLHRRKLLVVFMLE